MPPAPAPASPGHPRTHASLPASPSRRPGPAPVRGGAPALVLLAVLVASVLGACDLAATMKVSAEGKATIHVETFIEASLIDGKGPTCKQVMDGILEGWITVWESAVTTLTDPSGLRCTLDQRVDLVAQGWDGQSGSPLWQSDTTQGRASYVLDLPFSQGTGSGDLTTQDLTDAGLTGAVSLAVTMPGPVTSTSAGTVEGDTVTVTGVDALVKDLVIRSGPTTHHAAWWVAAGVIALSLACGWGARRLWRIQRSRRGREGHPDQARDAPTTSWPADWPGGSSAPGSGRGSV